MPTHKLFKPSCQYCKYFKPFDLYSGDCMLADNPYLTKSADGKIKTWVTDYDCCQNYLYFEMESNSGND